MIILYNIVKESLRGWHIAMKKDLEGGRPTKFNPSYTEEIINYFNISPNRNTIRTITHRNGSTIDEEVLIANNFPTLSGFACKIGVHRDTLYEWAHKVDENDKLVYPEFADAYKRAKDYQEYILVTNGLQNLYSPAFAIFTAKNVIGWRDRTETDLTSGGEPIQFTDEQTDRIAKRRLARRTTDGDQSSKE